MSQNTTSKPQSPPIPPPATGEPRHSPQRSERDAGILAAGGTIFGGMVLVVVALLHALVGITAIAKGNFYLALPNYVVNMSISAWGWTHLVLAVLLLVVGICVLVRQQWSYVTAIVLAVVSVLDNFLFLPHYPLWSLVIIALDVFVIWALSRELSARDLAI